MKREYKLAFYKAFQPKATLLDKIIAFFSGGLYSHVELVCPDGKCFSISPRENKTRIKRINLNNRTWEVVSIGELDQDIVQKEIEKYKNKTYDYIGAIFSVLPICFQKEGKVFCSELVTNILRKTPEYCRFESGCKYSPNELYEEVQELRRKGKNNV